MKIELSEKDTLELLFFLEIIYVVANSNNNTNDANRILEIKNNIQKQYFSHALGEE